MKYIIGISSYYHDSAACLLADGEIIACAQEERFSRIKHDPSFPIKAIKYILSEAKITLEDVDQVVFYEKPFLKFERLLETYLAFAPMGLSSFIKSMPLWIKDKLFQKKNISNELKKIYENFDINKISFSEHHLSHAASAFYPSSFDQSIVLTLDGVGEWSTTAYGFANNHGIKIDKDIKFPHSLGLLYSAFTFFLGFKVNSGEYKVMGLAPYGKPKYCELIFNNLIDVKEDGSFRMNMKFFNYPAGLTMINKNFEKLFGRKRRVPEKKLDQFHMDIAASIQHVTESIIKKIVINLVKKYNCRNICLAGGVALNCVANGKLISENIVDQIWIQPAAGDAGGALGAALAFWHEHLKNKKKIVIEKFDLMKGSYLGPQFSEAEVINQLDQIGAKFEIFTEDEMLARIAEELTKDKAIGWFQGRMEFGPRALGNRSIIASPISEKMQKNLNLKVKFRESFRPFAPSVIEENAKDYFQLKHKSPYMLLVSEVNDDIKVRTNDENLFGIEKLNLKRSNIPSVTHVDYSARIQTIDKNSNRKFYNLIKKFYEISNCAVLINTSFNIRGEPIVCSIEDAYKCFMGTNLDFLVIGNLILNKNEQPQSMQLDYRKSFELD